MKNSGNGQSLTLGEKRVRTEFNPSSKGVIDELKQDTASLINKVEGLRGANFTWEKSRLIAEALRHYETAVMYAVKAATAK